jgi:phosphoribosylglycinamide formyltransferase-1
LTDSSKKAAILISGSGTNLQAFIDRQLAGRLGFEICVVFSNRADAYGLERAERAGIAHRTIAHGDFPDRESFDRAVAGALERHEPDLLILAGFMRILSPWFVRRFAGRILNIHPALLPKYPGLDTYRRVLDAGDSHHGSTVHFVTEELDGGPPVLAGRVAIQPGDTPDTLMQRVQAVEHQIYPDAADWLASGRLECVDGDALLDGERLTAPVVVDF